MIVILGGENLVSDKIAPTSGRFSDKPVGERHNLSDTYPRHRPSTSICTPRPERRNPPNRVRRCDGRQDATKLERNAKLLEATKPQTKPQKV